MVANILKECSVLALEGEGSSFEIPKTLTQ
jgi:hypothetical protein